MIGGSAGDTITGNLLANLLLGGPGGDTIFGGPGNDRITGGDGDDQLDGQQGNDVYVFGEASVPEIDTLLEAGGGGGIDTLDFSLLPASDPVSVDLTVVGPAPIATHTNRNIKTSTPDRFENVVGTPGDDILVGNAAANRIEGRDGNDQITGLDGDDWLVGGGDHDLYHFGTAAGPQDDTIEEYPGGGEELLMFGTLTAGDPVTVDLWEEIQIASHTNRTVWMAPGTTGVNIEDAVGGQGDDVITGSAVANALAGRQGNDELYGGRGDDLLVGGQGNNTIDGGAGDDLYFFLNGVAATDTLVEDSGAVIDGLAAGGGSDTLNFSLIGGVVIFDLTLTSQVVDGVLTVNLNDSNGPNADYFENLVGSQLFGNQLFGNDADNLLVGGPFVDLLSGRAGNDVLLARDGDDALLGGDDNDILLGGGGDETQIFGEGGRDIVIGGDGSDMLDGDDEDDILIAGDVLFGGGTEDENIAALQVILAEWGLTDRTYAQRVADISAGVGVGGLFALTSGGTVIDDGDPDTLTGGPGIDWFFRNLGDDTVTDLDMSETTAAAKSLKSGASDPAGLSQWIGQWDRTDSSTSSADTSRKSRLAVAEVLKHVY